MAKTPHIKSEQKEVRKLTAAVLLAWNPSTDDRGVTAYRRRRHGSQLHGGDKLVLAVSDAATTYSSLEPCAKRASHPRPCAQLIQDVSLRRVVTA